MLRVSLTDLDRAGSARIEREVPADDPLWAGIEPELAGPVTVDLELDATPTGQVVARGRLHVVLEHECRRCLARVERPLEQELALVWAPPDDLEGGEDGVEGPEIRTLDVSQNELDIGEAIREELVLAAPRYVECREDCRGLCPRCGINRNEESCDCVLEEPDPRWAALRKMQDE